MIPWFPPMVLALVLTGFVFLYLQGRLLLHRLARLSVAFEALREAQAALAHQAPLPSRPEAGLAEEVWRGLEERFESLSRELFQRLKVPAPLSGPPSGEPSGGPPKAKPPAAEEILRRFLLDEGFTSILVSGREQKAEGVRFRVRAKLGDQTRSGHALVAGERVSLVSLDVPTAFFP